MKPLRHKIVRKKINTATKDPKIYMPVKKTSANPIRKAKRSLFKKKIDSVPLKRKSKKKFPMFFIYFLLFILFGGIIFLSVKYINQLRNKDKIIEETYVTGLDDIPAYPNSVFIFSNSMDQDSVKTFLSNGNSAYRLPSDVDIKEVFTYYENKLGTLGWTYIQMVPMESDTMEYGQYWTKYNRGLRIYSKYNDVWYQSITIKQAANGMADEVAQKTQRDLLLADSDMQDLLPDFPWILSVPKDYLLTYKVSYFDDKLQQLTLSRIGADEKIYFVPVGKVGTRAYDYFVNDYITNLNTTSKQKWGVQNTVVISTNWGSGLKGTISNGSNTDEIVVIPNTYNNVVYMIDSSILENQFVDYMLENLKVQSTKKY